MAVAEPWNVWAVRLIREVAYHGQPEPIDKKTGMGMLRRDMAWAKYQLMVKGESRERLEQALRGAALVWPTLKDRPWSPAKAFTMRGAWVDLFERAITVAGKQRTVRKDMPQTFRRILEGLAR